MAIEKTRDALERYFELEELLGVERSFERNIPGLPAVIIDHNDAERAAEADRAAENAAALANNRYQTGLIDFQTILQTQRTLLSAQESVASVKADLSTDHVRLIKALGGGWH